MSYAIEGIEANEYDFTRNRQQKVLTCITNKARAGAMPAQERKKGNETVAIADNMILAA